MQEAVASGEQADTDDTQQSRWTRLFAGRILDFALAFALIGLVVLFTILSPVFFNITNLWNILDAEAAIGIMAVGMTFSLISGQIDLSVGSILGFSSCVTALALANWHVGAAEAIAFGLVGGLAVGVVNGSLVVDLGINSLIATLGTLSAVQGFAYVITKGEPIEISNNAMIWLGTARPLGVPIDVLVMFAVYLIAYITLKHTVLGTHIYAIGGSTSASERAGLPVRRLFRYIFLLTGITAGIAGVLTAARTFSGAAVYGQDEELYVLTAVLLGGVGLRGGEGNVVKTLLGVAIVGVLTNGLILTNVPAFWTEVAQGLALLVAVVAGSLRYRRGER